MPDFISNFEEFSVRNLDDIIKFNDQNQREAMPEQANGFTHSFEHIVATKRRFRADARKLLQETFEASNVNIIVAPGDSSTCIHAAAAGYPIAAVPLGQLRYDGRPFGLCLLAKADREDLVAFQGEQATLKRAL
ncbi:hypothetical protein F5Y18DRAFT_428720 [Xylariaceae sp. FL1019]|nr:hypothetical protein F5Y18DRAFT_428720 [Xylariaceae sp. FL1019]